MSCGWRSQSVILGAFATAAGVLGGGLLLRFIIAIRIPSTLPDIDVVPTIGGSPLVTTVALGVVTVGLAPLLTWRRLRRMDVAAALKVSE